MKTVGTAGTWTAPAPLPTEGVADAVAGSGGRTGAWTGRRKDAITVAEQAPLAALALGAWRWLRGRLLQKSPAATRDPLRLVARLALGGRKSLALVEVGGVRYLVGEGADTVTAIVAVGRTGEDARAANLTNEKEEGQHNPGPSAISEVARIPGNQEYA